MKWFKHFSDSYSNLKHQQVMAEVGLEGYAFFWICCELVAQQGDNFRIKGEKNWRKALSFITHKKEEDVEKFLEIFGRVKLISEKALVNGDLYIPKIGEYSDEYTAKLRRVSGHNRDNVVLEGEEEEDKKKKKIRTEGEQSVSLHETSPSEKAKEFFKDQEFVIGLLKAQRIPEEIVRREVRKFVDYWTEPNKSGTKTRWEMQKTFEIKRRLSTWFSRVKDFNPKRKIGKINE